MVRDRFPDLPQGHWMLSNELVRVGKLDEAEAAIEQGISHFPDERFVLWQWGRTATQRHDWPEAVRRWEVAKSRHPDWGQIDEGIAEMHNAVRLGRIEDIQANEVAASVPMRMTADNAAGKLLMRFEGLGDNCEFGIVQRSAGVEPLGLLRWANISAAKLIAILDARFQGVGEEQNTRLDANDFGEYQLIDTRYFGMHTFINTGQATVEELMPKMLRRLRFLKEKLIEDLTEGEKIFVHKSVLAPLGLDEMRAVAAAIRRYGRGTLVCVQIPPVPEKDNCVERIEDGLFAGYLSKLTRNPLATRDYVDDWLRLCRAVEQLL
jgi:hypothetical protein